MYTSSFAEKLTIDLVTYSVVYYKCIASHAVAFHLYFGHVHVSVRAFLLGVKYCANPVAREKETA